jgi:hypothetical protein
VADAEVVDRVRVSETNGDARELVHHSRMIAAVAAGVEKADSATSVARLGRVLTPD